MDNLLEVRGLKTHFATDRGLFRAVDGISFSVPRGRTIGLVGESGCGKSVTSLSVMGLVPSPPGKVEAEAVLFGNRDVLKLTADERRRLRGGKMSMIFQEPMTSLNPVHTVGQQIVEAILAHTAMSPRAARARAIEMLELGADSVSGAAHRRLSAQHVGRHAAASHDRDGALLRAGAADRRRADHGARRHHPGANS
ncbi:ABC-type dipeptide/oligopeptide/nickel transport system ATPase component [Bradyrhizobium sp. AZCC 1699]